MINSALRCFPLVPLHFFFPHSNCLQYKSARHVLMIVLLALVCISNRFCFLIAVCLPPQSFFFFFPFCIFIIAALNLYFPPSSSLPLSFLFQLRSQYFCYSLRSISVCTREPVRGEYVCESRLAD